MEQNIHVINTKSEVQSLEISTKRPKRKDDQEVIHEATRVKKFAPNATENGESTETSVAKAPSLGKAYMSPIPFPQGLKKNKQDTNYENFLDILKKLQINIFFIDAILQIPSYVKFLKEMLTKKIKLSEFEIVALTEESSARVLSKLPPKLKDTGNKVNSKSIMLQLADRTIARPRSKVEDEFVKAGNFIFIVDFIVLNILED
ncbi:uncharacterized protein LOC111404564 [Olea europaea var. sylvestris]|uniref:uncharacterized protein LOC111404564 n=1 Tax=Olea europaea var. sylvestris TaxID=158386 RepID=UPI000C1D75E5|nr:uncharacterized protein LOC111404564 [Olea europaea var. sylvestris]